MPLYFAYGANMDVAAMAVRCPSSKALGTARLARHKLIITKDGYASVVRHPRADVHGVLWELALSDVATLDRFEEVDRGLYSKLQQPVIVGGAPRRAMVYVANSSEAGTARPGYLEYVIAAAESWNLPKSCLDEMRGLMKGPGIKPRATGTTGRASEAWSWRG